MAAEDKKEEESVMVNEPIKISYIFPNGNKYEGDFGKSEDGKLLRNGTGTQSSPCGFRYTGEWHDDKMHGTGTMTYPTGASYKGEFHENMYHGNGTFTFPDGSIYKGQFHQNRIEGDGSFTDSQGLVWKGVFHKEAADGLKLQLI